MELRDVNVADPDVFRDERHHEMFTLLRREDPVHWQEEPNGGAGFWCVTKHADIIAVNRDATTFSSEVQGFTLQDLDDNPDMGGSARALLPGMDAPRHTRHRLIVNRGFTPRMLTMLEQHLAARASAIVDRVAEQGSADFVADIASELPLQAIAELMGVPQEDRRKLFEWSNTLIGIDDPEFQGDPTVGMQAATEMYVYADGLRQARADDPHDDIITKLVNAEIEGDHLTDEEFGMFFMLLTVAGNETTRNATAHGMRAFMEHRDRWDLLTSDLSPATVDRAADEVLRWASPVLYFRRTATKDVELRDRTIRAGDKVAMWYVSGNRDEEVFEDPFAFDIRRTPNEHVAFGGGGPHFCLGANLARLELRLIFTELARRLPDIRLEGDAEMLRSNFIGGIKRMPVGWTPVPVPA